MTRIEALAARLRLAGVPLQSLELDDRQGVMEGPVIYTYRDTIFGDIRVPLYPYYFKGRLNCGRYFALRLDPTLKQEMGNWVEDHDALADEAFSIILDFSKAQERFA